MKYVLLKLGCFVIILGVVAFSLNTLFQYPVVSYISYYEIGDIIYYKFDVFNYLKNLEQAFTHTPSILLTIPEFPIKYQTGEVNDIQDLFNNIKIFFTNIANDFLMAVNITFAALTVLTFPFRLIAYLIQVIVSVIGIKYSTDRANPFYALTEAFQILTVWQIPYIPYIQL